MTEKFNREKEKNENLKELKARLNFEGCSGTSRYSESKTMSTKEHDKRHRPKCFCSPRTSVFSRIRHERSKSPLRREACLKGWKAKERVCPHAQIAIIGTLIQGTREHSQRVKIVKVGIGSQDQKRRNQAERKMTCLNPGRSGNDAHGDDADIRPIYDEEPMVEKSIDERAQHKKEYDSWVNERPLQTTKEKVDTSKALDASLVDTESSGT
nr:hypothetical protein [Tanacetum cinerariifolium]